MSLVTVAYAVAFYLATIILVGGLIYRIREYATVPSPLKIPTMPAPLTPMGAFWRVVREVIFFESLFKSNKWIWIFGVLFHAGLAVVLIRHLRYFIEPVWFWVVLIQPFGVYAGFAMVAGLFGLWGRRVVVDRVRYISSPSDHLMLALLVAIGISGLIMRYVTRTDVIAVKAFFMGLMRFDWQPLPTEPVLLIHLGLVVLLMVLFPFSKLLHIPGLFFSPTRNQWDNAREKRHLATWAAPMDAQRDT